MKNITFIIIFSFFGQFLMAQCLDISIENQQVVQGSLYFDIYLQKNANTVENIHLGTSDFVLNYATSRFVNPQFQQEEIAVAASCILSGNRLIVNLNTPAVSDATSLEANTLLVGGNAVLLGRFHLSGFQEAEACLAGLTWKTEGKGLKTKLHHITNVPRFPNTALGICETRVDCTVGNPLEVIVPQEEAKPAFSLQPNPATDFVLVNGSNLAGQQLALYNALGQKIAIAFKSLGDEQLILDLKGLPTGVYVVEMRKDGVVVARKFVLSD